VVIDAIIIGAGIIGTTLAKALQDKGSEVMLLDDGRPMGGTPPSGGHLKPSWFSGMGKALYEPAMKLLDEVWGLEESSFTIRPTWIKATVYRVDTDKVVSWPKTIGKVTAIKCLHNYPIVEYTVGQTICESRARLLVIAAGVWCAELVPELKGLITPKRGVSFRVAGVLKSPFIKPWAPYKQVVAHQQGEREIWVGDGTAVLDGNWDADRTAACRVRCLDGLRGFVTDKAEGTNILKELNGLRPYTPAEGKEPCLLKRLGPRAWVATGAGKLGTIAAGWVARRILDA
jgi:glycine/D-amino acid oxidase-like deaminating enzyme